MSKPVTFIMAASAAALSALAFAHAETQTYDFSGFSVIDASAGVDVEVRVGGAYSVRAEGEPEALERLRIERDGDVLEIGRVRDRSFFSPGRKWKVVVYVNMPELNGVDASSGSDVTATGIDAGEFSASVSSGADASLRGTCATIKADGSSGADLNAEGLQCENAVADVSSGADLTLYASESLVADASSGGDITVYGAPKNTNIDKSSGGDVHIRD
ncbi:head GIN domain-containing protein [Marinicaulis aureus]|uniref:Head GIN domain-containing protein n=1 Tax=Hyphococcus aureus TaxID=2666033 RepID=A0ABW1KSM6_9PROT